MQSMEQKDITKKVRVKILLPVLIAILLLFIIPSTGTAQATIGDINGDSRIDIRDLVLIQQHVVGKISLAEQQRTVADVNGDGRIDAHDIALIMQRSIGMIATFQLQLQVTNIDEVTWTVPLGTPQVVISLPATVTATISDGTRRSMSVQWETTSTPAFNPNAAGTYIFMGNLANLPGGITNPKNIRAIATITVLTTHWPITSSFTVTFDARGGSAPNPASRQVTFGLAYGTLPATTRAGYTFAGWYTAVAGGAEVTAATSVTTAANHTLFARWTANNITVAFDAQGGSSTASKQVTFGSTYGTLPTPTRANFTFVGWFTTAAGGIRVTEATPVGLASDHTLFARWQSGVTLHTVNFNAQGGITPVPASKQVTFGSPYRDLATTTRPGYTFVGWFTEATGGTMVTAATIVNTLGDHTLHAHWRANDYTVTFNAQGGITPVPAGKQVTFGSPYRDLATTTRPGYTFAGWFTSATGAGDPRVEENTIVTTAANHTLFARWTAN